MPGGEPCRVRNGYVSRGCGHLGRGAHSYERRCGAGRAAALEREQTRADLGEDFLHVVGRTVVPVRVGDADRGCVVGVVCVVDVRV